MERKILSAVLHDRSVFDRLHLMLADDDMFSDQAGCVYKEIDHFYSKDAKAENVDVEWLKQRLGRKYERHADLFMRVVDSLEPVSAANIMEEAVELRKQNIGSMLSGALMAGDKGQIDSLMEKYQVIPDLDEQRQAARVFEGTSVQDLLTVFSPENMIKLYPSCLNDALGGGLPKGAHLHFYARPEAGKTLTAVNLTAGICNAGHKVIVFGNEDPPKLWLLRVISRLTGMTRAQIMAAPDRAHELAMSRGYGNLRFIELTPGTISEVRQHILEYEPDVSILDQLTNLALKDKSKTEKFEELAYRYRMLIKDTGVAGISFAQAGESAEGKLMLAMDDVYYSNTGIAAQCDAMVGIGKNGEYDNLSRRMLSLPKNKLSGDHEPVPVQIDPTRSVMSNV